MITGSTYHRWLRKRASRRLQLCPALLNAAVCCATQKHVWMPACSLHQNASNWWIASWFATPHRGHAAAAQQPRLPTCRQIHTAIMHCWRKDLGALGSHAEYWPTESGRLLTACSQGTQGMEPAQIPQRDQAKAALDAHSSGAVGVGAAFHLRRAAQLDAELSGITGLGRGVGTPAGGFCKLQISQGGHG